MNKILVITTKGCVTSKNAVANIIAAIKETKKNIPLESKDFSDIDVDFIIKNDISDFPTVVFFINDKVVYKCCGSYPIKEYVHLVHMYF